MFLKIRVYDLEGNRIISSDEIQNNHSYVVTGRESFMRCPYGETELPRLITGKFKSNKNENIKYLNDVRVSIPDRLNRDQNGQPYNDSKFEEDEDINKSNGSLKTTKAFDRQNSKRRYRSEVGADERDGAKSVVSNGIDHQTKSERKGQSRGHPDVTKGLKPVIINRKYHHKRNESKENPSSSERTDRSYQRDAELKENYVSNKSRRLQKQKKDKLKLNEKDGEELRQIMHQDNVKEEKNPHLSRSKRENGIDPGKKLPSEDKHREVIKSGKFKLKPNTPKLKTTVDKSKAEIKDTLAESL